MTTLRRIARWLQPYRHLWLRERDDHNRTRAALAEVTDERDRARDLIAAMVGAPEFSADDEAFLRSLGDRGPA